MQIRQSTYFDDLSRRTWATWLWAGLAAAGLNLVLFLLMPRLVDPAPSQPSIDILVPQINVIRIKRPETEVRHQPIKPPDPPQTKPEHTPKAAPNQPVRTRLTLPFEINPRLPGGPSSLVLPPLESAMPVDPATLQGAFSVGQLDSPLTALTRIPPVYPMRARRRGIGGWVKVAFIVDEIGKVGDITVLAAEPVGLFEKSVEDCMRGWRFKPGKVEGMAVKVKVETTIRFELE